jgi:hypothetical protein
LPNRSFAVASEDGNGAQAIVQGRFSRKFTRAKGSARLHGKFNLDGAGRTKCDSGKQKFVAKVTG